ncbi:DMT family transporter [Pyxidicoccus sp. MSG2]|uniref:DMT family transporter n=1 Tax=Pyxidicoccus sp. MSG2 TaxID=2996790 RepID=UPI002270B46E|nr:DMT family transporter [Pyxidicoccus sp. MSG2]MCY1018669.1 DMT family transporter [Pyxidicoccus sp. MSG2]
MMNAFLFILVVLVWGTTWIMTRLQLGVVDVEASIAYRFVIASAVLLAILKARGLPMRFRQVDHVFIAAQGLCLFCLNSLAGYNATRLLPSGLVAVVLSTVVLLNIAGLSLFFREPVKPRLLLGALLAIAGLGFVFRGDVTGFDTTWAHLKGGALALLAALLVAAGNMLAVRNRRHGLPVAQTTGLSMLYGAAASISSVWLSGRTFGFDASLPYVGSLLYLAIIGTAVIFTCYLVLLERMGADRAAYVSVLYPVVALGISTLFEGYVWSSSAIGGLVLLLGGNALALLPQAWPVRLRALS